MDKKILVPGVAIVSLLSTISAVWAQDFIGSLNEGLNQAGAFVVAICFLVGIVVFIATYLTTKLNKPGWRNVFIIMGLLLIGLVLANAFTGGAIALYFPGIFGLIIGGIMGVLFIMEMFVAAEYLGKREIWRSPTQATESLEKSLAREAQSRGAGGVGAEISGEEKAEEDALQELRELVNDYRAAMKAHSVEEKDEAAKMALQVIKVFENQELSMFLEGSILLDAKIAGSESLVDNADAAAIDGIIKRKIERKNYLDADNQKLIAELVKTDEAALERDRADKHQKAGESKQEQTKINAIYALHKQALGVLKKVNKDLVSEERNDKVNRSIKDALEAINKKREARVAAQQQKEATANVGAANATFRTEL